MSLTATAQAILRARDADLAELARIAGLDPKRHFRGADLRRVDFGDDDLSGFDFREADVSGANLLRARGVDPEMFAGCRFDDETQAPPGLLRPASADWSGEPIGFWSYTTSDDLASRGQLSRLRLLIADDLQRLIGREPRVHIFQDVAAIPKGASWEAEINAALDAASFIIPILTPAFLQSEWCCREVLRFRLREQALGRDNLIFPFHYTDTSHVDPHDKREVFDPSVHALLSSRQRLDFRELELEDPDARAVRYKLRELSTSIRNALRPVRSASRPAVKPPVPVPGPSLDSPPAPAKPDWADSIGRDAYGVFVAIVIPAVSGEPVTQRLRWIPPGRFMMGSPPDEFGRYDLEGPMHEVSIGRGFWLFDTPCTQALWQAVMDDNPSVFRTPDRPVETVSFQDVETFLSRINAALPGLALTLPSEARWEYACRAGTDTATYAGPMAIERDNNAPVLDAIAWYGGNSGRRFDLQNGYDSSKWPGKQYPHERAGTRPVALKAANPWGLYDMLGNVWEWCLDHWHDSYAGAPVDGSSWLARAPASAVRVIRGGSWLDLARRVRAAYRFGDDPAYRNDYLGFRCARVQN
jgi:formylglycine-generating enzyme required for sulfatase activity